MNILKAYHLFYTKWFVILLFVFVAFMPCSVKSTFFLGNDFQVAKVLNVTKIPSPSSTSCFSFFVNEVKSEEKTQKLSYTTVFDNYKINLNTINKHFTDKSTNAYFANAPPLYILYKQLKVYDFV